MFVDTRRSLARAFAIWLLSVGSLVVGSMPAAQGATFTPTRFDDPFPDGCNPGDCSLREAIIAANASTGPDTVNLAGGTYKLSIVGTDEDAAADGDLDVTDDLTITGPGSGHVIVDGNGTATGERVFHLDPTFGGASPAVSLSGLTITGGTGSFGLGIRSVNEARVTLADLAVTGNKGSSFGGGIFNEDDAVMTISDSVISNNTLSGSFGTGIMNQNDARLTILDSTVSGNSTEGTFGGGLFNQNDAFLTIDNSTITGNTSNGLGGGLFLQNTSTSTITNTTVSGNRAVTDGGGFYIQNSAAAILANTTITGNSADSNADGTGDGGGIFVNTSFTGSVTLRNSILAGNTDPTSDPDCDGTITSGGYNLIGVVSGGCAITAGTGDQTGTPAAPLDPRLGPLASNGGPTQTHSLLAGSPAIDAGNPAAPGSGGSACPATDQRGASRKGCDIGAYELVKCRGVVVNALGTEAKDNLKGTGAPDGILGLGGKDTISGKGGKDGLCGGPGKDRLKGGGGKDRLDGGPGRDVCLGQAGKDKAKACEVEKQIP